MNLKDKSFRISETFVYNKEKDRVIPYDDFRQSVLKLISNKKINMFSNDECQEDTFGIQRLEHNQQLQFEINEIKAIFGDFEK